MDHNLARTRRGTMTQSAAVGPEIRMAMRWLNRPATYLVTLIALGLLSVTMLRWTSPRRCIDHAQVPLSQSEYLKDVVEPVSMVVGMSWDDGGSKGLVFRDSRQVIKSICLLDNLAGEQGLIFGTSAPDSRGKRKVPPGGPDEQALLGLLERWYGRDPDAMAWNERIEQWEGSDHRYSILRRDETKEQIGTGVAVSLMRRLRRRN
jgi:hypothetical protein